MIKFRLDRKWGILLLAIALVFGLAPALPAAGGDAEVIWATSHETGDLSDWYRGQSGAVYNTGGAEVSVTDEVAHTGRYALKKEVWGIDGRKTATRIFRWAEHLREGYFSCWYMFPTLPQVDGWLNVFQFKKKNYDTDQSDPTWFNVVDEKREGTVLVLQHWNIDYDVTPIGARIPLEANKWFHIEWHYKDGIDDGVIQIWQDGQLIWDRHNVNTRGIDPDIQWAPSLYGVNVRPGHLVMYVDDCAISRQRIGPEYFSGPTPTATATPRATATPTGTATPAPTPIGTATPTPSPGSGDIWEPDDTHSQANWISADARAQPHDFHVAGDVDWVKFTASAGVEHTIETSNLGSNADTVLHLYDTDGVAQLAWDDDGGGGLASRIVYTFSTSDAYYVKVRPYGQYATGPGSNYDLSVTGQVSPTPTPTPIPTDNLLDNGSFEEGDPKPDGWIGRRLSLEDRPVCRQAHEGSCSFNIVGTTVKKALMQVVNISGSAGDGFTLAGWSRAENPSPLGGGYCLQATVFHTDGTKKRYRTCFAKRAHGWQYRQRSFTTVKPYNKIVVFLRYKRQSGEAWFDDVRLIAD